MQHWARRLEQEIDGVMRIFGGVQQLREVSLLLPTFLSGTLFQVALGTGLFEEPGRFGIIEVVTCWDGAVGKHGLAKQ